jgi:hypothetical protein
VAGRAGAGGRGTDGTVGGPEGCLTAAASGPKTPALRTARDVPSPSCASASCASRPKESSTRSRMLDARHCIRMTPRVQSRRPHSAAVRVGATPGLWQPTGGPDLPHPCVVPIACPSERTTTVNNGATSPSHLPPDHESAQVSRLMAAQAPSLPKLRVAPHDPDTARSRAVFTPDGSAVRCTA